MQIASLSRLHTLRLQAMPHPSDAYGVLARASSLRQLTLSTCQALPACLSALCGLGALCIDDGAGVMDHSEGEPAAILAAALPRLTRLTQLALVASRRSDDAEGPAAASPLAPVLLAGLEGHSQLRSLLLDSPSQAGLQLPASLSGLRQLAVPAQLLEASHPALQAATGIRLLGVLRCDDVAEPAIGVAHALVSAVRLPQLDRLLLEASWGLEGDVLVALFAACTLAERLGGHRDFGFQVLPRALKCPDIAAMAALE